MKTRLLMFLALLLSAVSYAEEGHFKVAAEINGKPARLIFDTGAEGLALYRHVADKLGVNIQRPIPKQPPEDYKVSVGVTEKVSAKFFGRSLKTQFYVVEDAEEADENTDGFIGWPLVKRNIFVIDGQTLTVQSLDKVPEEAHAWLKLRVVEDSDVLVLETPEGGKLVVDTGDGVSGVSLPLETWNKWRAANPEKPTTLSYYYSPGVGNASAEVGLAAELELGPLRLNRVPINAANEAEGKMVRQGRFIGKLGIRALKRLDLIIDGKEMMAYLRPKTTFPTSFSHNRMGAIFLPENGSKLIAKVSLNGPAYAAGLRDGDQLLKINDQPVGKMERNLVMPLVYQWAEPAGKAYLLTIKRQVKTPTLTDREFTVFVELKDILKPHGLPGSAVADLIEESKWYEWLGGQSFVLNNHEVALACYEESSRLNRDNVAAQVGAGNCYNILKDYRQAGIRFSAAIGLDRDLDGAWLGKGFSLLASGKAKDAITYFNRAISLNPANAQAFNSRGLAYYKEKNFARSIADLDQALKLQPDQFEPLLNRGTVHLAKGDLDQAIADLSRAVVIKPENVSAWGQRAQSYAQKREYSQALSDFEHLLRIDPENIKALFETAWLLAACPESKIRDGQRAVEYAQKACELTLWREGGTISALAAAKAETGDFAEAVKWQQRFLEAKMDEAERQEGERVLHLYQEHKRYAKP